MAPPPKTVVVEDDEFDDDTDLPLPSRALPNTGTRGALLEEIESDNELDIPTTSIYSAPSVSSAPRSFPVPPVGLRPQERYTTDTTRFKKCEHIYAAKPMLIENLFQLDTDLSDIH